MKYEITDRIGERIRGQAMLLSKRSDNRTRSGTLARGDWPGLVAAIAFCQLPGLTAYLLTEDIADQYETQEQPSLLPPQGVIGAVWAVLNTLSAIALYLIERDAGDTPEGKIGIGLFVAQLGLNFAWSMVSIGGGANGSYFRGFVMVIPLAVAVLATTLAFARVSRRAALLLVPYLAWLSLATVFNYQGWQLNR